MKLFDLANSAFTAWIVALAAVGALSFIPSRAGLEDGRVARPLLSDVSVLAPALRGTHKDGVDDLARHDDEPYAEGSHARGFWPQPEPES